MAAWYCSCLWHQGRQEPGGSIRDFVDSTVEPAAYKITDAQWNLLPTKSRMHSGTCCLQNHGCTVEPAAYKITDAQWNLLHTKSRMLPPQWNLLPTKSRMLPPQWNLLHTKSRMLPPQWNLLPVPTLSGDPWKVCCHCDSCLVEPLLSSGALGIRPYNITSVCVSNNPLWILYSVDSL